jgi:integrase
MLISSDKACEHAKSEKPQTDFPVAGSPGLSLRVSEDGRKVWTLRYRRQADGKQKRLTLGTYPDIPLKDARIRARKARGEASDGGDPAGAKQDRRKGETFDALARQWIAFKRRQGRAETYVGRCEFRLRNFPKWFAEMKAAEIKRVNVTAVLEEIAKRGATTETNRHQAFISAVLKWAVSEGLIERDASAGVKRRFAEEARERVFSDDEVRAFWFGLGNSDPRPQLGRLRADGTRTTYVRRPPVNGGEPAIIAMRLCFVLGQRPKEIAHLRKDKLALDALHPTATVDKTTAKNRTEHVIPLPRLAVELLRRACEISGDSEWVFPDRDGAGPLNPNRFSKIVERLRNRSKDGTVCGVKDAQLYDSKKTVATFLGDAGYPDQFIGLLFNHLTAKGGTVTGKHYNHARYMAQKREMIELWARHLEGVLGIARDAEPSNVVAMARGH